MTVATLSFVGLAMMVPRERRVFHYITAAVTMVASIAYFSMASNLGWTSIDVEYQRNGGGVGGIDREIFYVRYIDWFITTPLLLMDLLLTAAMPWPTVLWVIMVDEMMIVTGLVGALVESSYKWGYFVFGCVGLCYIFYVLVWEAQNSAALGKDVGQVFLICGSMTALLWWLYPSPGCLRRRQHHLTRLRSSLLRHSRSAGQACLWRAPHLGSPRYRSRPSRPRDSRLCERSCCARRRESREDCSAASNGATNGQANGATNGATETV